MRSRLFVIALAMVAFGVSAAPTAMSAQPLHAVRAHENETKKCSASNNACMLVFNAYPGSDYVTRIYVFDPNDGTHPHTYRVLFDGVPRYQWYGDGGTQWTLNYYVNSGRCIRGGVEGVPDARTPCWVAP
jgi:hypothetical protein